METSIGHSGWHFNYKFTFQLQDALPVYISLSLLRR